MATHCSSVDYGFVLKRLNADNALTCAVFHTAWHHIQSSKSWARVQQYISADGRDSPSLCSLKYSPNVAPEGEGTPRDSMRVSMRPSARWRNQEKFNLFPLAESFWWMSHVPMDAEIYM